MSLGSSCHSEDQVFAVKAGQTWKSLDFGRVFCVTRRCLGEFIQGLCGLPPGVMDPGVPQPLLFRVKQAFLRLYLICLPGFAYDFKERVLLLKKNKNV